MALPIIFSLSFFFSFIGSIPPGTLNLTIIQLGLSHKIEAAWRFALAAALIEYPYAWIAVKSEKLITSSPWIVDNLHLLTAIVMTVLGIFTLWTTNKPSKLSVKFNESGFRRGIILSILNPLALPYWIGITAYLKSQQWIDLSTDLELHCYLAGVSIGALTLLILLAYLAKKVVSGFLHHAWFKKIPGFMLLGLGIYAFLKYLI